MIQKSMRLKHEPSSEPLHNSAKQLFLNHCQHPPVFRQHPLEDRVEARITPRDRGGFAAIYDCTSAKVRCDLLAGRAGSASVSIHQQPLEDRVGKDLWLLGSARRVRSALRRTYGRFRKTYGFRRNYKI